MKRLAFYGGSFNPAHVGHQATILHVLECADVQGVMVAPAYKHPDGKELVDFDARVDMLWELVNPLRAAHCPVWVDRIEYSNWAQHGSGYTLDALRMVLNSHRCDTVVLALGSDIKETFHHWLGWDGIEELIAAGRVEIFWVDRVGDISSTAVRHALKQGLSTKRMLPRRIADYIVKKGLYQ